MRIRTVILAAVFLLGAASAFGQACSMCYSTAKATSKDGQTAISRGVLVLLVPTIAFMTLGVCMAIRYAKKRDFEQLAAEDHYIKALDPAVFAAMKKIGMTSGVLETGVNS
jgi:hypothetical protein